jgi:hypothetical protein
MILDQLTLLSDGQAITVDAGSTNCLDLGAPGIIPYGAIQLKRNFKGGKKIPLLIQVTEAFATLTSLEVIVQSDDNSSFSSPKDLMSSTVAVAELKAGYIFAITELPKSIKERYIRVYYNVIGSSATAGKITAAIVGAVDGAYNGN